MGQVAQNARQSCRRVREELYVEGCIHDLRKGAQTDRHGQHLLYKTPRSSSTRWPMSSAGLVPTAFGTFSNSGSRARPCSGCPEGGFLATSNGFSLFPEHPREASASNSGASHALVLFPCRAKQPWHFMYWLRSSRRHEHKSRNHRHSRAGLQKQRLRRTRRSCRQGEQRDTVDIHKS